MLSQQKRKEKKNSEYHNNIIWWKICRARLMCRQRTHAQLHSHTQTQCRVVKKMVHIKKIKTSWRGGFQGRHGEMNTKRKKWLEQKLKHAHYNTFALHFRAHRPTAFANDFLMNEFSHRRWRMNWRIWLIRRRFPKFSEMHFEIMTFSKQLVKL